MAEWYWLIVAGAIGGVFSGIAFFGAFFVFILVHVD